MVYFIVVIVFSIIWGVVAQQIIENKGYSENWFWWGFLFGVFAIVVALSKPSVEVERNRYQSSPSLNSVYQERRNEEMIKSGGWKCKKCGKVLSAYTGTCGCGNTKIANESYKSINANDNKSNTKNFIDTNDNKSNTGNGIDKDNIDILIKFKDLLDNGIITQEEFDSKKKQLLNL